jgi:23S rRNA (uracil1939-C5)-methyltransferase
MRRRRPEADAPAADSRPPKVVVQEPRYEMLERTNPHVISAAKTLAEVEEIELQIERLVFGGEGLGRYDGVPIFVPRSAPGEKLRVRVVERRTGWGRAEIVEILEASPERREAPCPYFDRCGGCDLQHLDDAAQLRHKAAAVCESLVRQGGVEIPKDALEVIAGAPWAYRTRTQLHVAQSERGREVGYFARNSHQLVAVDVCPILVPELEKQLPSLPRLVRDERHERIDLTSGDDRRITCSPPVENLPHGSVERVLGGFRYEIDARVFFQSHRQLAEKLVEVALGEASDEAGEAYDLYAGVGLFALPLARRYKRVVAVEGDRVAVRFARRNVKANGIANVSVEAISVDSFVELLPKNIARVLVDPPRVGLSTPVRRALIAARPRHLTYVSCHAPTLARDLRELLKIYRLEKLSLLDMFPQTGHMEVVAQLKLQGT